jgi:DNA processing protein
MLGIGSGGPRGPIEARGSNEAAGNDAPAASSAPAGSSPDELEAAVLLGSAEGVGPVSYGRLIGVFGSARAALEAALRPGGVRALVAATAGADGEWPTLSPEGAQALADLAAHPERLHRVLEEARVRAISVDDPDYPPRLRLIELPPPVIFVQGDPAAMAGAAAVAIVGTRRPSWDGRDVADRIATAVAGTGATIVSGLALGIDAQAHAAAVRTGSPTVAVIGGGHGHLYPRSNGPLARAILAGGGTVVSEFPPDVPPTRGLFPRRNRLISGLADATVVVEAGARSGALTTAAWALEQGRELYLVPGPIDRPTVAGCLAFLREAAPEARIVAGVTELLEDLGLPGPADRVPAGPPALATLGTAERAVAERLLAGARTLDEIVHGTGMAPAAALAALTVLEVRGLVDGLFGRYRPVGALDPPGRARRSPRPSARPLPGAPGGPSLPPAA